MRDYRNEIRRIWLRAMWKRLWHREPLRPAWTALGYRIVALHMEAATKGPTKREGWTE